MMKNKTRRIKNVKYDNDVDEKDGKGTGRERKPRETGSKEHVRR